MCRAILSRTLRMIDVWVSLAYIGVRTFCYDGNRGVFHLAIAFIATNVHYEDDLLFVGENSEID